MFCGSQKQILCKQHRHQNWNAMAMGEIDLSTKVIDTLVLTTGEEQQQQK